MANIRKHNNPVMVSFYLPCESLNQIDKNRKKFGRGEYVAMLINSSNGNSEDLIATISKLREEIKDLKKKKGQVPSNQDNNLEELRMKVCDKLLLTPWRYWQPGNKIFARKTGKFKDNQDLESWVLSKQNKNTGLNP